MKIKILTILLLFTEIVHSQSLLDNKRDHVWMFGFGQSPPNWGGTCLNFNNYPVSIAYVAQQPNLYLTNASICDQNGNLLFYCNGMHMTNANHQIMPNGGGINYGQVYIDMQNASVGYCIPQGALILPRPNSSNLYYILHEKLVYAPAPYDYLNSGLYYSIVNMNMDNGLGDVEQKNVPLITDTLDWGYLTAVRHANGRDWWILVPEAYHNIYYRFLLSPEGIIQQTSQQIGISSPAGTVGDAGTSVFSTDGSKYCRYGFASTTLPYRLDVYDFDRCSGLLSNYRNLSFTDLIDGSWCPGMAVSSNSRFMYVLTDKRVFQYDLFDQDINASQQTVGHWDGFVDPLNPGGNTRFELAQLGPDHKIYFTAGPTPYLHVINNPDSAGLSCNVSLHSVHLNTYNDVSMPNLPNFSLGPLTGSECDTLGIHGVISYDNSISSPMDSCLVYLRTIPGAIVDSAMTDHSGLYRFGYLYTYPPGLYKISVKTNKPWGGVNSVDALNILRHFVGFTTLSGLKLKAADVNLNNNVNAGDALEVQRRFIGTITSFPAGDWLFEEPEVYISDQSLHVINIKGICVGDVNGSYIPPN